MQHTIPQGTPMLGLEYNGRLVITKHTNQFDIDSMWFILKNKECSLQDAKSLSKVWSSIKSYNCSYSKDVMEQVQKLGMNVHVKNLNMSS